MYKRQVVEGAATGYLVATTATYHTHTTYALMNPSEQIKMVSGNVHTVELKGLHNAQLNSLKLYTYKNGVKGTQDLLSGISTMADGYGLKYTAKLASGTYWVEGYDANKDCNGGMEMVIADDTTSVSVQRAYEIYARNSGWVAGTDYTIDYQLTTADGVKRTATLGSGTVYGNLRTTGIFVETDTVTVNLVPSEEHTANYKMCIRDRSQVRGEVELDHVSFTYPGSSEVLHDIDLTVAAGETVAIVGPSGGGKSTLCQMVPRFYDVTEGSIRVDGLDVRQVTQRSLRRAIGIVQQDVFLFADTIRENIRYGRPDATDEEVEQAAHRAELLEDIRTMPQGFDTYVGERGAMLSGGQKQRVAIARIFLKDPAILILDEATSALDSVTEAKIQGAFDQLSQGRTTPVSYTHLDVYKRQAWDRCRCPGTDSRCTPTCCSSWNN